MHFKLVVISICILLLSFGIVKSAPAPSNGDPLVMVMEATGAQVEEVTINAWVRIANDKLDDEGLTAIVQQVMGELGARAQGYQLTQQQTNKEHCVQAEAENLGFHTLVIAKKIPDQVITSESKKYLIITIEDKTKQNSSIRQMQEEIRQISAKYGTSPHISTCLIGWLNGTLRDGEQHDLLQKAFKVIDAKIVDELEEESFISYTGFTSRIIEWLQVGGQKINLNMAMHYSQYDNRTYVTIGSPIITREY